MTPAMNHCPRILTVCVLLFGARALASCHERAEPAPRPAPLEAAPAPAPPTPATNGAPQDAEKPQLGPHRSPVVVKLVGPEQVSAGQDIEVVAEVERFVGSSAAVELRLLLPEGASLVSGNLTEQLPPGSGKLVRRFVVHLDRVPATDIEVVAETSSRSFGAHARSAYRFGRAEPRFTEPPRTKKPLTVNGKELGKPIQLHP